MRKMKAIQIKQYGGAEQLKMVEATKPRAAAGQVVVRIVATSFNRIDPNRPSGNMRQVFPLKFPFTPGGDFSGVVDSVGEGVKEFSSWRPIQQRSYAVLKQGSSLVAINQPPSEAEAKDHHVKASMLVTETSTASLQKVTTMIDTGKIKPFVGKVYPLSEVAEAWRDAPYIEGKTVFAVSG